MIEHFHGWIDTFLELLVVIILVMEYRYDAQLNDHVKAMKKRVKKRFEFESLTDGEGK